MDLNNESEELYECQIKSMSGCEIPRWISGTRWDMVWIGDSCIPSLQWLQLMKLEMIFLSKRIYFAEPSEFPALFTQVIF